MADKLSADPQTTRQVAQERSGIRPAISSLDRTFAGFGGAVGGRRRLSTRRPAARADLG